MSGSILVTGASGFLGKHLVNALRRQGEQVIPYSQADGNIAHDEIAAEGVRHVYHLAARTYVPDSWTGPREFYEVNVLGTINVLEFCRESGASVTLVSSYVYGRPERLPIPENHPLRAFNPYAHSKLMAEDAARFYQASFGIPVTIIRPFNLYGPMQSERFLIPTLIRQALSPDLDAISVADHRPRRDYIFVDDMVDMLTCLNRRREQSGTYNAGSGVSYSVQEVAEHIAQLAGTGKRVISREQARQDEVLDTVADISRARAELHWVPKVGLEEGLRRTVDALRCSQREANA
jgi:nucleoside-diphosphate-sugar epimerase